MSTNNQRPRGRPAVDSELLRFREQRDVIEAIDAYAALDDDKPTRPEAIRRIVREALEIRGLISKAPI